MSSTPSAATTLELEPLSLGAVLRVRVLRRLWYAQVVSVFGDFLALFAVISVLTFRLHASPEQVTRLQISYLLPLAILSVLAGVFVDRWPVRPTLVASDLTRAGLVLLLLFATRIWHFYAVLFAISLISSFFGPAQGVAIRSAVPTHGLRAANALMQQAIFGMRIIGPALATALVASFGPRVCYWADAATFVASAALIGTLPLARHQPTDGQPTAGAPADPGRGLGSIVADLRVGLRFLFGHAGLLFVIVAFAAGMFVIGCFGPLIAIYIRDSLHETTRLFGVASAMIGVGMLIGSVIVNGAGKRLSGATLVSLGLAGIAAGLVLLATVLSGWATVLACTALGFAVAAIVVPATAVMQAETPGELMGRVGSTVTSIVFTAQIAGLVLSGELAGQVGVRNVFAGCAGLLLVLVTAGTLLRRRRSGAPAALSQA